MGSNTSKQKQEELALAEKSAKDEANKKLLEDPSVIECHSKKNTDLWLHLNQLEDLIPLFEEYLITGDSLLDVGSEFGNVFNGKGKYSEELMESISKIAGELSEKHKKIYNVQQPVPNFKPHKIPEFQDTNDAKLKIVKFYHDKTKNFENKGSRSTKREWMLQPKCIRRFWGAKNIILEIPLNSQNMNFNQLFELREPELILNANSKKISEFFYYSFALTAKKDKWQLSGMPKSAWSKRVNASSGGLHPSESYVILPRNSKHEDSASVFHYSPTNHSLERLSDISSEIWNLLTESLPKGSFFFGLALLNWREIWKYGERAWRYGTLDLGHALCSARISASRLGYRLYLVENIDQYTLDCLFGTFHYNEDVNICENELAKFFCVLIPNSENNQNLEYDFFQKEYIITNYFKENKWFGTANTLSYDHTTWNIINSIEKVSKKKENKEEQEEKKIYFNFEKNFKIPKSFENLKDETNCDEILRNRRSALDFKIDEENPNSMTKLQFFGILERSFQDSSTIPFDLFSNNSKNMLNLFMFVYRIEDLKPGLYVYLRCQTIEEIKEDMSNENFVFEEIEGISNLYLLEERDISEISKLAKIASCSQDLAEKCSFCISMISKITEDPLDYERQHIEGGVIGQLFYIQSEAFKLRSTGMGCFTDDFALKCFGLDPDFYRAIYHFAVGNPVIDGRYPPFNYTEDMFEGVLDSMLKF